MFKSACARTQFADALPVNARLLLRPPAAGQRANTTSNFSLPSKSAIQPERHWNKPGLPGSKRRLVKYKELAGVLWRRGSGSALRLLVIFSGAL